MSQKIFDKTLVAILKREVALKFNKPAYAGICVLELSNLLMYEFHYDYIKSHFECQHVLFNNKFLIHSMKSHRIGTYRIIKISLLCFDDKIYIQNNRHDGLALG